MMNGFRHMKHDRTFTNGFYPDRSGGRPIRGVEIWLGSGSEHTDGRNVHSYGFNSTHRFSTYTHMSLMVNSLYRFSLN